MVQAQRGTEQSALSGETRCDGFGTKRAHARVARLRLARALLSITHEDSRDVGVLRRAALEQMALDYKRRSNRRGGPHSSDYPAAGLSLAKGHTEFERLATERSSSGDIAGHAARAPGCQHVGIVGLGQSERDEPPAVLRRGQHLAGAHHIAVPRHGARPARSGRCCAEAAGCGTATTGTAWITARGATLPVTYFVAVVERVAGIGNPMP